MANNIQKIYLLSRKIHRWMVLGIIVAGLVMLITGMCMKFPLITLKIIPSLSFAFVRYLHNNFSSVFAILFLGMLMTGSVMFFYPYIQAHRAKKSNEPK